MNRKLSGALAAIISVAFIVSACAGTNGDNNGESESGAQSGATTAFSSMVQIAGLNVSVFDGTSVLQSGADSSYGKLQMSITPSDVNGADIDLSNLQVDVVDKSGNVYRQRVDESTISPGDANVYYLDSSVSISDVSKVIVSDDDQSYTFVNE